MIAHRLWRLLQQLPVQLFLCVTLSLVFGTLLSTQTITFFYTISCIIKEMLFFVLPAIIFVYIFDALLGLDKKAPILLLTILTLIFISNMTATTVSYGMANLFLPLLSPIQEGSLSIQQRTMLPFLDLQLPQLLEPNKALFLGIILGLGANFLKIEKAKPLAQKLHKTVTWFLRRTFIPILPIYIAGFVLKLQYEGGLGTLVQNYFQVFILTVAFIVVYIGLLYFIGSGFKSTLFYQKVRNMLPAGITGFSTMSSAATMPVTIQSTEKNLHDPRLADIIIPTTANIHLLGDVLAIPLMALSLLWFKTGTIPGPETFALFALMFSLTKFSCAGIPGGGVIVILPVVQHYLGLDAELISLMTTIYILQDSIFTCANVMGNGAFALIVEKIYTALFLRKNK